MSKEDELKMIPRQEINMEEVLDLLKQEGYVVEGPIKQAKQEDTYYDTPDRALYNSENSLRIRRTQDGVFVTYKNPIPSETTYKQRDEYEEEIPQSYIKEDGSISIEDAINILKQKYPEIELPENLGIAVKVNNNRHKVNVKAPDGTVIEMAFDDLQAEDEYGELFEMNNELECEVLTGTPDKLEELYNIISKKYDVQINDLSKYIRAIKEINEQKQNMTLDEITLCAILSDIIGTNEFQQLRYKGQIIHDYRVEMPANLDLSNFKDFQYLMRKISAIKRIKNYRPGKIKNLEEMFFCFFSDMSYQDIEYKLVNFLNENYYREDQAITNRMSHSQQVMLITGLISRSKEISEQERNLLLCMISGQVHDIGHVPGAHPTERLLGLIDGFFSHEINGRDVIERIISRDEEQILAEIKKYTNNIDEHYPDEKILDTIQRNKAQIKKSIEEHSRTNSESRGDGTVVQLPREADKICYAVSDIVDVIKRTTQTSTNLPEGFFSTEWKEQTSRILGKGYEREERIRKRIEEFEKMIRTNNFGEMTTNIANTVRENVNDGKTYYDVEQDTWDILNAMIDYVKSLRESGVIDRRKRELQNAATLFIIKKINEAMAKNPENVENAWDEALRMITNSNDLEMLNEINAIKEKFQDAPSELKDAFEKGGILDTTVLENLDNSDRQIKIQPQGRFQLSDMLPYFGVQYSTPPPDRIRDTYFNNHDGISICLREYETRNQQDLLVKKKREKRSTTS